MAPGKANLQKLNESAFAIVGADGLTNFGIIKGSDGSALLIDADIRRIDEIDDGLTRAGCNKVRYLLNTHENFDHSSANDYFAKQGALVLGSEGCQAALKDDGAAKFDEMAGRVPELKTRYPDIKLGLLQLTFSQSMALHLPGIDAQIRFAAHNGISHSRGDSIATIERDRILFSGDLLYTDYHPVTVYGDIGNWISSIDQLLTQSFACVVPGHGPVSQGADRYRQAFEKFRGYLSDFHGRLLEVKAGRASTAELEAYMTSGAYERMGKTYMVKRNIEFFSQTAK